MNNNHAGIYIHIPFCIKKCPYCSFYSCTQLSLKKAFINALLCEIDFKKNNKESFDSIYLGGGTPSLLEIDELEIIINALFKNFKIRKDCEITIEINPQSLPKELFFNYCKLGINRISIGTQSFLDKNLKTLKRNHSSKDNILSIKNASSANLTNISIDLIYGIFDQTISDFKEDLKKVKEFKDEISHLSAYILTGKDKYKNKNEDDIIKMFYHLCENLETMELKQYEISNFAKDNMQSKHNLKYWNFNPYLSFGPSAHSFDGKNIRVANKSSLKSYIEDLKIKKLPVFEEEILSKNDQIIEYLYLYLRQKKGIDINNFNNKFKMNFEECFFGKINKYKKEKFLRQEGENIFLSKKGMLISNALLLDFIMDLKK